MKLQRLPYLYWVTFSVYISKSPKTQETISSCSRREAAPNADFVLKALISRYRYSHNKIEHLYLSTSAIEHLFHVFKLETEDYQNDQ